MIKRFFQSLGRRSASDLLAEFVAYAGWTTSLIVGLMVLIALLESAGLMMLPSMLQVVGINGGPSGVALNGIFQRLHIVASLSLILSIYVALISIHSLLSWFQGVLSAKVQMQFIDEKRHELYSLIGLAEWSFLSRMNRSQLSHVLINEIGSLQSGISAWWEVISVSVVAVGYLAVTLWLSPTLATIALASGLLILFALRRVHQRSYKLGQMQSSSGQRVYQNIDEYLSGIKLAKSGNAEARLSDSFMQDLQVAREHSIHFTKVNSMSYGAYRIGAATALSGFVYVGLAIMHVPAATILALIFVFMRLLPQLSDIQKCYGQLMHSLPAYENYVAVRESCRQSAERVIPGPIYQLEREIRFSQVAYKPLEADEEIIREVSFSIPAHTTTALVGPSGAGKSTLADLLTGLVEPSRGALSVDGRALDARRIWRDSVAYVPQEVFLFNATVKENLLWLTPDANDEMLWEVLRQAAAEEFVRKLPLGLQTPLGERGIRLSGGERQRLAIARALLRRPRLLVLDEATSALDRANELHIQNTLLNLHHLLTIVIIAHRPATIRCADQVLVVSGGKVVKVINNVDQEAFETLGFEDGDFC